MQDDRHTFKKHSPVPIHLQFDIPATGTSHLYSHFFVDRFSTSSSDNSCPKCILKELQICDKFINKKYKYGIRGSQKGKTSMKKKKRTPYTAYSTHPMVQRS